MENTDFLNQIDSSLSKKIAQLSPAKRALLELKLKQQQVKEQQLALTEITPIDRNQPLALSFGQQRFWILEQLEGKSGNYNIFQAFQLKGNLHLIALKKAFQTLVDRHETLRTHFSYENDSPVQIITPQLNLDFPIIDLREMSEHSQGKETEKLAIAESQKPFDLSQAPLIRVTLIHLQQQTHLLFLTVHHIIFDGLSSEILIKEVSLLYQAYIENKSNPLTDLAIQYVDFTVWQRQWLTPAKLESHLSYWRSHLENSPTLLNLPTDRERPLQTTYKGNSQTFVLNSFLTQELKRLSGQSGVTLFVTLLSAFAILLNRYSTQEDLIIGTPVANRPRQEIESLIGFFVNTLPLRINLNDQPTFVEFLGQVRQVAFEAYRHQDLPFEKLIEELKPERSLNYHPLFQVMFVLQNQAVSDWNLGNLTVSPVKIPSQNAQFDLTLSMKGKKDQLQGTWIYNTDLFDADRIERMTGHLQTLLEGIVNNPQEKITHLPILTSAEKQQILIDWNNTKADYPKDKCIHQLFEEQVIKTPDNIAVIYEEEKLTYQELNEKANQVAHYLQKFGIKPDTLLGICVEKSLAMIIGILAILKAGGAYVPLDPNYPQERLKFMLEDSQISILLTQEKLVNSLQFNCQNIIKLDTDWELINQESKDNLITQIKSNNLAYVIYTSGSTGTPKGVMIEHQKVVNLSFWRINQFRAKDLQVFAFTSSLSFDVSVLQVFPPFMVGGKVVIVKDLAHFETVSHQEKITFFSTLPSVLENYLTNYKLSENIEAIGLGGEKVNYQLIEKLMKIPHLKRIYNSYGPTETTVGSCSKKVFSRP